MRFKITLVSLLLFCPCALCYGQLRFASVGGEKGYAAMRASYRADLDNGFVFVPSYGYYRMSDKEIDEAGSTSRFGLEVQYELADALQLLTQVMLQPQAIGYEAILYDVGFRYNPFYYWQGIKNPALAVRVGQERYRAYVDSAGKDLAQGSFRQVGTSINTQIETDVKRLHLQGTWQKVLKYNSRVPNDVTFSWADIPYMTAVLQGYIKDCYALRLSYPTNFISPYASLARYHYQNRRQVAAAVSVGVHILLWGVEVAGGIEVFEPRRDDRRKTYFSLSVEMPL